MIDAIRSEQIKLRTVLMHWVLAVVALAFPLVITLLNAFFRGDDGVFDARSLLEVVTGSSFLSVLLVAVIAAASITGEFGFNTIRPTFAAVPRRGRVVIAKAIVLMMFAALIQLTIVLVGWFGGRAIAESRGATILLDRIDGGTEALVGSVVIAILMSVLGLGVGLVMRSTPAAVATLILWPLLVENLIGALLTLATDNEKVADWMPFRAGFQAMGIDSFDGPSRVVAAVYFGGFALVVLGLGSWLLNRRDA